MSSTRSLVVAIALLVASAPAVAQSVPRGVAPQAPFRPAPPSRLSADEQDLIQLERDWDGAFQRQDTELLDRILGSEFLVTYGDGTRGDKAKEMSLAREFNQQVDSRRLDDFTVKVFGDTAVVWFSQQLTGPRQGKSVAVSYRFTDVFVRRDGRWQAVASHSTRVGERALN